MNETLDSVALKQLVWKPSTMRNVARRIVERALACDGGFWPDELPHDGLSDSDRHCIGTAWRLLIRFGIIAQTGQYRRSQSPHRNSGAVFQYRLASWHRATLFLQRNPATFEHAEQPDLLNVPPAHTYPR